jgi:hypothetical protein
MCTGLPDSAVAAERGALANVDQTQVSGVRSGQTTGLDEYICPGGFLPRGGYISGVHIFQNEMQPPANDKPSYLE